MSAAELNALEREVERTRARFANDLARLRSPHNIAEFKEDLWAEARDTKDGFVADLTARAAANPLAVAALVGGVAWRLFHRPPIATLLVGLGLVGLLRTSPTPSDYANAEDLFDPDRWPSRANDMAESAKQKVQDWGAQAKEAARDATEQATEIAASMADRASDALSDVADAARDRLRDASDTARDRLRDASDTARARMTRFADDATSVSDQAAARVRAAMPDRDDRDKILLGAAALAVTAAVGIAFQRRGHQAD
jgi:gas vesicle protein